MKKLFNYLLIALTTTAFYGCPGPEPDPDLLGPGEKPEITTNDIVGTWVTASDETHWREFEFLKTTRMSVTFNDDGITTTCNGMFYLEPGNNLSANYDTPNGKGYIDWTITEYNAINIKFDEYDNNTYLGKNTLYKLFGSLQSVAENPETPDYRELTGTKNVTDFRSLNPSILTVDNSTGEITGLKAGTTLVFFKLQNGEGAVKVEVTSRPKTLRDYIVGTWIYENQDDNELQYTKFTEDGYVYVKFTTQYSNTPYDDSAQGKYTVKDNSVIFNVTTTYGAIINQEWVVTDYSDYEVHYDCFSDNASVGTYYGNKLIGAIELDACSSNKPDYQSLTDDAKISGYKVHRDYIANVEDDGTINALFSGGYTSNFLFTYVDVLTDRGTATVEVTVKPCKFEKDILTDYTLALGKSKSELKQMFSDHNITLESSNYIWFWEGNHDEFVKVAIFNFDSKLNVESIQLMFLDDVDLSPIKEYLAGKYFWTSKYSAISEGIYYFTEKELIKLSKFNITMFEASRTMKITQN